MLRSSKRTCIAFCAAISLCLMAGCPTFRVVSPGPMQTTSQEFERLADGRLSITVTFNENVDGSSLIGGTNVILVTELDPNASVTITTLGNVATIISVEENSKLLIFDSDGFFSLRLLGSGSNPIRSADGDVLDGDANGSAGGDFETGFVLLG